MEVDVNTSTYSQLYRTCRAVQGSRAHKEGSVGWVQRNNDVRENLLESHEGFTWISVFQNSPPLDDPWLGLRISWRCRTNHQGPLCVRQRELTLSPNAHDLPQFPLAGPARKQPMRSELYLQDDRGREAPSHFRTSYFTQPASERFLMVVGLGPSPLAKKIHRVFTTYPQVLVVSKHLVALLSPHPCAAIH
jgi:hypothetical protein